MSNFITNDKTSKNLKHRLLELIKASKELKFLVGFFYFSGWQEVYQALKQNPNVKLKILVGLQVEQLLTDIVEYQETRLSAEGTLTKFVKSLSFALNNDSQDTEEFYKQVGFFVEMLENDRLIIRKTLDPNHSKLYLFKLDDTQVGAKNTLITGSSNLTRAGLGGQNEFNVEIRDYGFEEAEQYFDQLWETAIPITEAPNGKRFIIDVITNRSLAAEVSPFEAYAFILKTYIDLAETRKIKPSLEKILEENGFKKFKYQLDAVNQALNIIENYGGVIIADVVGLGKSVIASMIARQLGKRGLVLCPPSLIGDKYAPTGWWEYIQRFGLYDWEVESIGKLEQLAQRMEEDDMGIEVVIVDEAHRFRNQDTASYEALSTILRGKTVILLTATPFNNSPADIFSLLKLFIVPGRSGLTINDNIAAQFHGYNYRFRNLSFILKNYNSPDPRKQDKAIKLYTQLIGENPPVDERKVRQAVKKMSNEIKRTISSIVIRRNRLDLLKDAEYSKEITQLSRVEDPKEIFFELNTEQSAFYDKIIEDYFGFDGRFTGAIYRPALYEIDYESMQDKLDEEQNRIYLQQSNLYDFMRRILVKRFESSFGAFEQSVNRFLQVHKMVLDFVEKFGIYFLDRKVIEDFSTLDQDEDEETDIQDLIERAIEEFKRRGANKKTPKHTKIYYLKNFVKREEFINDIKKDIQLFEHISKEIQELKLVRDDPKRKKVIEEIKQVLSKSEKPKRKIVLFSEYVDTIKYLKPYFQQAFDGRVLFCEGSVNKSLSEKINQNFNAQYPKNKQKDDFDLLVTSDKLSEGVNLNRAGIIINYDIPWNPTRVIQRVGRINRIGTKVFDELYIYNFFPTEQGADIVKSREIASQKMFLIHNALGEDAKIFDPDEEPTPSKLYKKINANPDQEGELSLLTIIRNKYNEIKNNYPDVIKRISDLPNRIKTSKPADEDSLLVLRRKGLALFSLYKKYDDSSKPTMIEFEDLLQKVECQYDTEKLDLSKNFWRNYEQVKKFRPQVRKTFGRESFEQRALNSLKTLIRTHNEKLNNDLVRFINSLIEDLKNYQTLPQYTLRRLTLPKKNIKEEHYTELIENIKKLRKALGDDYLEKIRQKTEHLRDEVIIAVENQRR